MYVVTRAKFFDSEWDPRAQFFDRFRDFENGAGAGHMAVRVKRVFAGATVVDKFR